MESWIVSAVIGVSTYFAMFVTLKNKTEQHSVELKEAKEKSEHKSKESELIHSKIFDRVDEINQELASHKVRLANSPNMEQVRAEFISKEMFHQMEKHIDEKFNTIENGIDKILNRLESN